MCHHCYYCYYCYYHHHRHYYYCHWYYHYHDDDDDDDDNCCDCCYSCYSCYCCCCRSPSRRPAVQGTHGGGQGLREPGQEEEGDGARGAHWQPAREPRLARHRRAAVPRMPALTLTLTLTLAPTLASTLALTLTLTLTRCPECQHVCRSAAGLSHHTKFCSSIMARKVACCAYT